jgi:hypothetical protein
MRCRYAHAVVTTRHEHSQREARIGRLKVFISWSGLLSHEVAKALRDWLPLSLQFVQPYVSSEDIDKGSRWSTDIAGELDSSNFGIICLTSDNVRAPWINFEAGALSKAVDKSRVCPILIDLPRSALTTSPLVQFQSTLIDKSDMNRLFCSINFAAPIGSVGVEKIQAIFDHWWPNLEKMLVSLISDNKKPMESSQINDSNKNFSDKLEEITNLIQQQNRIINDPESLFPIEYIDNIIRSISKSDLRQYRQLADIEDRWRFVKSVRDGLLQKQQLDDDVHKLLQAIDVISKPVEHFILMKKGLASKHDYV